MKPLDICIDFDGTCVKHEFPKIGEDCPGAVNVLKRIVANGHNLILFTMRSDRMEAGETGDDSIKDETGPFLTDAVNWFKERDIPLYGIQSNPKQKNWTTSPKAYGQIYIDDAALGAPLIFDLSERPYIDWDIVEALLIRRGIIS